MSKERGLLERLDEARINEANSQGTMYHNRYLHDRHDVFIEVYAALRSHETLAEAHWIIEQVKLQAQAWKQEARTANATVNEIYQIVSGYTGEPGNWHGANPVKELKAKAETLAEENERLRDALTWKPMSTAPRDGTPVDLLHRDSARITEEWWVSEDEGWSCGIDEAQFIGWMIPPHHAPARTAIQHGDKTDG